MGMPDQTDPNPPEPTSSETAAAIRRRMIRIMTVEFVALMGVAAVQGFWPGGGPGRGLALVFLAASAIVMPVVMARMAAPMLRDVDRLTQDRDRLEDLYGQAREDSLLDGLTGLGNHRAFQEELARQLEHGDAPGIIAVAPARGRRRPQEGQR